MKAPTLSRMVASFCSLTSRWRVRSRTWRCSTAVLNQPERLDQRMRVNQHHRQAKAVHQVLECGALDRSLEHGHPLAAQIEHRLDRTAAPPVDLGPAVEHRRCVKVVQALALRIAGDVGHQVNLPRHQGVQAILPTAGDILQRPSLARGHQLQQIHKDACRLAARIHENLGLVGVHAHAQFTRCGQRPSAGPDHWQQHCPSEPADTRTPEPVHAWTHSLAPVECGRWRPW